MSSASNSSGLQALCGAEFNCVHQFFRVHKVTCCCSGHARGQRAQGPSCYQCRTDHASGCGSRLWFLPLVKPCVCWSLRVYLYCSGMVPGMPC